MKETQTFQPIPQLHRTSVFTLSRWFYCSYRRCHENGWFELVNSNCSWKHITRCVWEILHLHRKCSEMQNSNVELKKWIGWQQVCTKWISFFIHGVVSYVVFVLVTFYSLRVWPRFTQRKTNPISHGIDWPAGSLFQLASRVQLR
jgi:hypothetical protein